MPDDLRESGERHPHVRATRARHQQQLDEYRTRLCQEVRAERSLQATKGHTPRRDVELNNHEDWYNHVAAYNTWARQMAVGGKWDKYRRRLIQVAALALAAVEALDRRQGRLNY